MNEYIDNNLEDILNEYLPDDVDVEIQYEETDSDEAVIVFEKDPMSEAADTLARLGESLNAFSKGFIKKIGDTVGETSDAVNEKVDGTIDAITGSLEEFMEQLAKQKEEIVAQGYSDKAMEMTKKTLASATKLPLVHVDREDFLTKCFGSSPYIDKILEEGPQAVYSIESIDKKAEEVIKNSTRKTSMASFATGFASNPAVAVAATAADVTQFFATALNLAQKIAYLYGEDQLLTEVTKKGFAGDFLKKDGEALPEEAQMKMIGWLGAMMGVSGASTLIIETSKQAGAAIGKEIASQALTKTVWYPILKKVGSILGYKITKKTVENVISKAVPVIGGFISGGLTYASFNPMGKRLSTVFSKVMKGDFDLEMELNPDFALSLETIKAELDKPFVDVEFTDVSDEVEKIQNTVKKVKVIIPKKPKEYN